MPDDIPARNPLKIRPIIEWTDPPPDSRGNVLVPHETVAALLRSKPGQWGRIVQGGASVGLAHRITSGAIKAYRPAGSFEAVIREGAFYARYVGGKP